MVVVGSRRSSRGAGRVRRDKPCAEDVPVVVCRVEGLTCVIPGVASDLAQALEYARRGIELLLVGRPSSGIHGRRDTQSVAKGAGTWGSRARREDVVIFVEKSCSEHGGGRSVVNQSSAVNNHPWATVGF